MENKFNPEDITPNKKEIQKANDASEFFEAWPDGEIDKLIEDIKQSNPDININVDDMKTKMYRAHLRILEKIRKDKGEDASDAIENN